jgi:hypothetical protein
MSSKQTEQIVKPDPIYTNKSRSLVFYTLNLNGDKHALTIRYRLDPFSFISNSSIETTGIRTTVTPLDSKEPIHIYEKIDIEEWKKALDYDESKIDDLLYEILVDFDIQTTSENMQWLKKQIDGLVLSSESIHNTNLPDQTRSMLSKLIIRMAYDKLCVKRSL